MSEEIEEIFESYQVLEDDGRKEKSVFDEVNFDDLEPGDFEDPYYATDGAMYIDNLFPSDMHPYILRRV